MATNFPSPLVSHQQMFLLDVARLIQKAYSMGFVATGGELWRHQYMQNYYFKTGASKTKNAGNHGKRLAIDLNLFMRDGTWATLEQIRPLGEYWKGLNPLNRWGGDFPTLHDGPHFERHVP